MVEILEYVLVLLSSSLLVGFSVGSYVTYSGTLAYAGEHAAFSSLVTLAISSIEHGSASVTLNLSNATISCAGGELTFASPTFSSTYSLPAGCDFKQSHLTGVRTVTFSSSTGVLRMVVT